MSQHTNTIRKQLFNIQSELERLELWSSFAPANEKLNSDQPFSVDTLLPEEWLQWIFIPRMHAILDADCAIPKPFSLAPYFEEAWKETPHTELIRAIQQLDQLVNSELINDK